MQAQSKQVGDDFWARIERAIIHHVLNQEEACLRDTLEAALNDIDPLAIDEALRRLNRQDVLYVYREQVYPHHCLLHLNDLGLISI